MTNGHSVRSCRTCALGTPCKYHRGQRPENVPGRIAHLSPRRASDARFRGKRGPNAMTRLRARIGRFREVDSPTDR